jgi:hypothetical protein
LVSAPLTGEQIAKISASKQIVCDGLELPPTKAVPREATGILARVSCGRIARASRAALDGLIRLLFE